MLNTTLIKSIGGVNSADQRRKSRPNENKSILKRHLISHLLFVCGQTLCNKIALLILVFVAVGFMVVVFQGVVDGLDHWMYP